MQSRVKAFAVQQLTQSSMQTLRELHAPKLIGLHSWSEKHMCTVHHKHSSYHDQHQLLTALISGLGAAS